MVTAFSAGRHIAELISGAPISSPLIDETYNPSRYCCPEVNNEVEEAKQQWDE